MSTLLEQASLVMIPSGYKEDVVYSQIPTSGAGDLSFTRASNGTRINSAGLVEVTPWNYNTYSENFTANWGADGTSTATNNFATAPNGTMTAAKVVANSNNGYAYKNVPVPVGVFTLSFYVKASVSTTFAIQINDIGGSGANQSSNFTVTTEWQRYEYSANVTDGTNLYINYVNLQTSRDYFIWGAQLNIGSTAKPYFPTTDRLNVPRLTYQNGGGGCPSLLLEKQSTNILTYSEDFSNAAWTKTDLTVIANAITSPDGTTNAQKIVPNTTNGTHYIDQFVTISSVDYTYTIYAKKGEYNYLYVNAYSNSSRRTWFDLNSGTVSLNSSPNIATIESVGNGWYRCTITNTSSGTTGAFQFGADPNNGTSNANPSFSGDGTSGIYVWGAQYEASSYKTSYIPTTSASATRVADLSTSDTIQTAQTFAGDFTIFADFVPFIDSTATNGLMILGGGASGLGTTYRSYLWFVGSNVYLSGDGEVNIIQRGYSMVVNQRVKIALTRVGTTVKMFVNGAQVGASATSSLSITIRSIGWSYTLPTYQTQGKINQILLSATGASDADAISLTTI